MKVTKFSKFLSLLLTLVLAVGLLPVTAAATNTSASTLTVGTGGTYATLTQALAAAADGDTIKMLSDLTESVSYTVTTDKTVTIDGNGKTLTGNNGTDGAALTLSNTGITGTIKLKNIKLQGGSYNDSDGYALCLEVAIGLTVVNLGNVTCYTGTAASSSGTAYAVYNMSPSVVNITSATANTSKSIGVLSGSGTVNVDTVTSTDSSNPYAAVINNGLGTVNVGTVSTYGSDSAAILNYVDGTVNVGSAYSKSGYAVCNDAAGTINVGSACSEAISYAAVYNSSSTGTINAGTISTVNNGFGSGTVNSDSNTATVTLTKGSTAACVLNSITVSKTDSTKIGTLPGVNQSGSYSDIWYSDSTKQSQFTETTVTGPATLYSVTYSASFTPMTDSTTANDTSTLGLVGTFASSSASSVATATISGGNIDITSVHSGTAIISVTDASSHTATIAVTVNSDGAIALGAITKYIVPFTPATDSTTANDTSTLGLVGTSAASSADTVATAAISDDKIAITSVSAGTAAITITDASAHTATIAVTVNDDGSVTLGTIEKYVAPTEETLANTLTLAGFTAAASGSTVTVTGTKVATDTLKLAIPAGVTVQWKASLTGDVSPYLVFLNGDGTFELAGGKITNTGTGMAVGCIQGSIVISGGTASSSSDNATVQTYYMGSTAPMLTMTGGNVISTSDELSSCAISAGGKTVITGGTITAESGNQVVLSNAVVVYQRGLLSKISSGSLSASVAVSPSKTYAVPTETDGLTATGYSVLADHVTAQWNYSNSGWTGVQVDYSGSSSGSWQVSYPAVQVVSGRHSLSYLPNGGTDAVTTANTVYTGQSYTVSANVFTRTNYTFTGWNTEADGKGTPYAVGAPLIGGPGSDNILLYAQWSPTGGGSNPTGGVGGVSTPPTTVPTTSGATATTTVTAQTGTNGTASASVTQTQVTSAIEKAQAAAKSSGRAPSVEIHVSGGSNASAVQTTVPKASVQAMASGKLDSMTLSSSVASMTFDTQAIAAIAGAASGDVAFAASKVDNGSLSNAARQTVGNHPVYNFSVTSGGSTISQFGGAVTVSVPYTPAAGENPDAIVAYYINASGEPELMQNCRYDAQTGTLVFTTTHFSTYAVGYNKVAFSDVAEDAWCYDAVTFLAARGITGGTAETTFSPNATLSRGQFITLVMRAYGIEPDESAADNFSDAGDTYYTGYLAAAKRLGISNGVGGNKFAPKQAVSRQQMFTLLYNALKAIDQLPEGASGKTLSDFTDSANISSYAQEAMASLVESGAVSGSNGNLRPTATTTRAQMAQVLYNLLAK